MVPHLAMKSKKTATRLEIVNKRKFGTDVTKNRLLHTKMTRYFSGLQPTYPADDNLIDYVAAVSKSLYELNTKSMDGERFEELKHTAHESFVGLKFLEEVEQQLGDGVAVDPDVKIFAATMQTILLGDSTMLSQVNHLEFNAWLEKYAKEHPILKDHFFVILVEAIIRQQQLPTGYSSHALMQILGHPLAKTLGEVPMPKELSSIGIGKKGWRLRYATQSAIRTHLQSSGMPFSLTDIR